MHRLLHVALREYTETVRTKFFIVSLFLTPAIMFAAIFISRYMEENRENAERDTKTIAIVDRSGKLEENLSAGLAAYNGNNPARPIEFEFFDADPTGFDLVIDGLQDEVRDGAYTACMVIAENIVDAGGESYYYLKTQKIEEREVSRTIRGIVQQAANAVRFEENNVSPALVAQITRPITLTTMDISGEEEQEVGGLQIARMVTPFIFVALLFMSIFAFSQGMLTSVIEEKNTRIVEVLLAAVSPLELMAGKIVGLAAVGISVMVFWAGSAYIAAVSQGYSEYVNLSGIHYFTIYYFLGFVLICSFYAAIGASCNSVQESQSLMTPLMLIVFSPMFAIGNIVTSPNGAIAIFFSYFPITSAMIMPLRIAADPDISRWEIWGSIAVLALAVPATIWIASRIFRIGILMYGKPPSLRELFRWVRQS